ncbi:MAG: hypothetical protein H7X70_00755 [Candidatus Kapabacteria bacterium]|nr:hypothetical protein [Candidatus Kapabacteria bacterium]
MAAQIDDLLDGSWVAPALDVLERRREDPLCLHCCKAQDLTEIPGIGKRTAFAIIRAVNSGTITSIEHLADTLCLTSDQFVLLTSCTSLTCACGGLINRADAFIRLPTRATSTAVARLDVRHALGRVGATYALRGYAGEQVSGFWATARIEDVDIVVGDFALRFNSGLIMGSARGLARNATDILSSSSTSWQMRPWTSTITDGLQRGIAIHSAIPNTLFDLTCALSSQNVNGDMNTLLAASCSAQIQQWTLTSSIVSGTQQSLLSFGWAFHTQGGSITGEVALDELLHGAAQLNAEYATRNTDIGIALWWYDPMFRSDYGSTTNTVSTPNNHAGFLAAARIHPSSIFALSIALTYGGKISRSYLVPLPTTTIDITTDVTARPFRGINVSTRLRYEQGVDAHSLSSTRQMGRFAFFMVRADVDFPIAPSLQGRLRVDTRSQMWKQAEAHEQGTLMFLDLRWSAHKDITIRARLTRFSSTSGDVAPRMLDATVVGALQIVVGNGVGTRSTLTMRWQIAEWLAASCSIHEDVRVVDRQRRVDFSGVFQINVQLRPSNRSGFIANSNESSSWLE